jgi:manganese peroxidase
VSCVELLFQVLLKGTDYPGGGQNKTMQAKSPSSDQFRLASDAALARDPTTACRWQSFIS